MASIPLSTHLYETRSRNNYLVSRMIKSTIQRSFDHLDNNETPESLKFITMKYNLKSEIKKSNAKKHIFVCYYLF